MAAKRFLIASAFLLSPDLLIMEYNAFGQTFYEPLAMVPLLLVVVLFFSLDHKPSVRTAAAL